MYINMYMQLQLSYSNNCTYSILSAYLTLHPKIKSTLGTYQVHYYFFFLLPHYFSRLIQTSARVLKRARYIFVFYRLRDKLDYRQKDQFEILTCEVREFVIYVFCLCVVFQFKFYNIGLYVCICLYVCHVFQYYY